MTGPYTPSETVLTAIHKAVKTKISESTLRDWLRLCDFDPRPLVQADIENQMLKLFRDELRKSQPPLPCVGLKRGDYISYYIQKGENCGDRLTVRVRWVEQSEGILRLHVRTPIQGDGTNSRKLYTWTWNASLSLVDKAHIYRVTRQNRIIYLRADWV